ncbi:hypothetical protein QVD17_22875 [Tagetes erecta]|uniref:Ionotropic glutamate receptor C-terminal domain-containing protein n=1 Tax=Tagetes erecta TaxID=13708 RepID=A0AAD8KJV0_TARER|nr:hypothetical protein QVD17_22875 [Tagetes erecta]
MVDGDGDFATGDDCKDQTKVVELVFYGLAFDTNRHHNATLFLEVSQPIYLPYSTSVKEFKVDISLDADICEHHLATTDTSETHSDIHMRKWIQEQINGTRNVCSDILGAKWKNDNNNKPLYSNATLNVCVPRKIAFQKFIDVNEDGILKGGYSIAIFCLALQALPFKLQPVFKPTVNENYTQTVLQLQGEDCEAVAGDITITSKRTKYADFTIPYMSSEIYMLVPAVQKWNQTLVTLIRPFTMRLWLTIICACIFIGVAIGILEYRVDNPEFRVPFYQKLAMIIWFPVSTFFFHEGRIHNRCSKIVLVIWLITIFIVIQIFTACLSSWLTVNQLQPKVPKEYHVVGYQGGSCVADFAKKQLQSSSNAIANLYALSSMDDYKRVLDNGTVDAIFEELPYIDLFIAKYGDRYKKVGPLADEPGLGFAFTRGSLLLQEFSRAVVKVTESPDMTDMKKYYFGTEIPAPSQPDDSFPQSLDVHSFLLLFIFMVLATITAVIFSEITLMRAPARIFPETSLQAISANTYQTAENEH